MSKSADKNTIAIIGGNSCPKCGKPMQRFEHSKEWKPQPGRGHYRFWDRCVPCEHFQHYAEAHVEQA